MDNLIFAWNVLKVVLGLGLLIFLHELGHFVLAKWNGVKVEKFSIGFGPTLASFRKGVGLRVGTGSRAPGPGDPPTWGETEYILAALPLGGYVKMLGEASEDAKDEEKSTDPRAYHNKSAYARMGIITAGVIMNLFLGVACFAFVHGQGGIDRPAVLGGVLAGSPAYKAGLRAGDEIVAIDGQRDVTFSHLQTRVSFSKANQVIDFRVKRAGVADELTIPISPKRDPGATAPTVGLLTAQNLDLIPKEPYDAPPGTEDSGDKPFAGVEGDHRIVAVGPEGAPPEPVGDQQGLARKLDALKGVPIVVSADPIPAEGELTSGAARHVQATLPVHRFVDFGIRLASGPVVALRPDSLAGKAGIVVGDRIVAVDGDKDFDPMRLPDLARDRAGKPMTLAIERQGKPMDVNVTPDDSPIWSVPTSGAMKPEPLDVPGLGLAIDVEPKVVAVLAGSPAARAGIKPGSILASMIVTPKADKSTARPKPFTLRFDDRSTSWPLAFGFIQEVAWGEIELTTDKGSKPIKVRPEPEANRFHPARGLHFLGMTRPIAPVGFARAIRLGFEETVETSGTIFSIFRRLAERRIGGNAFGGMIPIAQLAYTTASVGIVPFIHFLGVMSVNLAVLNFLPIPPLDGGQFVFLAGEKIRGRPLPESFLNIVTIGGVVLVLALILVINVKDVVILVQSYL